MRERLAHGYRATGSHHWLGWGFLLFLTSVFPVTLPLALSRSGTLEVTAADLVAAVMWAVLAWLLVTRRWKPRSSAMALLVTVAAFCAWFVVVTLIRVMRNDEVLQPFLVLRTTLLPLAGYLLLDTRFETRRRALLGLVVVELLLNLWHLGEWQNMRMSDFLGNSIVYAGLIVMLLPVNLYVASLKDPVVPRPLRWAAVLNMLAALMFPVWTGSRGTSAVALVIIVAGFLIMVRARQLVPTMLAVAAVAITASGLLWYVNPQGSAYGIYRLVPPPAELGIHMVHAGQASSDLAQRQTAVTETAKSDAGRFDLAKASLEHIKADPVIGDGIVYFDLPGDGVVQEYAAHDFVLEHVNAYGGVGFVLYAGLLAVPLWPALRRLRVRGEPRKVALLAGLMTAGLLTYSLTEPTTLIMVIMVPFYVALAAFLAPDHELDDVA